MTTDNVEPGYHLKVINKGVLGEASKIEEEYQEFKDALDQSCKIMALVELSDLVGAIDAYLVKNMNMCLEDLLMMNKITKRAFQNGRRN